MKHRKALLPKQKSKSNSSHLICSEERVKSIFLQHKPLLQHPSQPSGHTHSLNNITSTQTKKTPPCLIAFLSTLLVSVRICCFMLDTALRQPTTNKAKPCQKKNTYLHLSPRAAPDTTRSPRLNISLHHLLVRSLAVTLEK